LTVTALGQSRIEVVTKLVGALPPGATDAEGIFQQS